MWEIMGWKTEQEVLGKKESKSINMPDRRGDY